MEHHNKAHFWHFSVSKPVERSTQLSDKGARCRAEVSAGQTSGAGGGMWEHVGVHGHRRGLYEKVLLSGPPRAPAEQGSCEDIRQSCWLL